jgi:hypothetical protein
VSRAPPKYAVATPQSEPAVMPKTTEASPT